MHIDEIIIWIIYLIFIIWIGYDTHNKRIPLAKRRYSKNNGSLVWIMSCIFLWIFTVPYYLVKRPKIIENKTILNKIFLLFGWIIYLLNCGFAFTRIFILSR